MKIIYSAHEFVIALFFHSLEHCDRYEVVCTEKKVSATICRPKNNCKVRDIEHACVKDKIPNIIDLKETFCDKCVDGRKTIRPIHGEKYVCRDVNETFCANVTQPRNLRPNWKKWCKPNNDSHLNYKIHKEIASLTMASSGRDTVSQNIKNSKIFREAILLFSSKANINIFGKRFQESNSRFRIFSPKMFILAFEVIMQPIVLFCSII